MSVRRFLILFNPQKKTKRPIKLLTDYLIKHGHKFDLDDNLANLSDRFTDLTILGGDGTINYVVNKLPHFDIPIGVIPAGSGNDYVKSVNLGDNIHQHIETAVDGRIVEVDLGKCNDRYFVNGFGLGFDGQIAHDFEENRTIFRGQTAYYYHVLKILTSYQPRPLSIEIDGQLLKEEVLLLTISKGTTFGGGFKLTPHSSLTDGQFGICLIRNLPALKRFWNLPLLQKGTHNKLAQVEFRHGKTIKIEKHPNVVAHIDGELIGTPPFELMVIPKKLKLKVRT